MKKLLILFVIFIMSISLAYAVSTPVSYGGKEYYIVTSTDATEDSGNEVCAKVGKTCVGYTETTTAVCKQFHAGAADTSSMSGDLSGVYCDGAPQNGVCSLATNTCHACPACTNTVSCSQAIGNLYREMYVECDSSAACSISIGAKNTNDFFNQLSGINTQFKACPYPIPPGTGVVLKGATVVDVAMNNGQTKSLTAVTNNGLLVGISNGAISCKQKFTISENDLNSVLVSSDPVGNLLLLLSQKKITISGCTFISKVKLFFVKPIINIVAKKQAPAQAPPPTPSPNCGQIGEQCDNRGCFSGMCAAAKENINGQWMYAHYYCIDQSDYNANCLGKGNTPPAWNCLTGPCS